MISKNYDYSIDYIQQNVISNSLVIQQAWYKTFSYRYKLEDHKSIFRSNVEEEALKKGVIRKGQGMKLSTKK